MKNVVKVTLTAACSRVSYYIIQALLLGQAFDDMMLDLIIYDSPNFFEILKGVSMDILDCISPKLLKLTTTCDIEKAFMEDVDYVIFPFAIGRVKNRVHGLVRLVDQCKLFESVVKLVSDSTKFVFVGDSSNLAAHLCKYFGVSINPSLISVVCPPSSPRDAICWGYCSMNYLIYSSTVNPLTEIVPPEDNKYYSQLLSSAPMAYNVCKHLHALHFDTLPEQRITMGVCSDGSYEVAVGLVFGFPVTVEGGVVRIKKDLVVDKKFNEGIKKVSKYIMEEISVALRIIYFQSK